MTNNKEKIRDSFKKIWISGKQIVDFKFNSKKLWKSIKLKFKVKIFSTLFLYILTLLIESVIPGNYVFSGYAHFFFLSAMGYFMIEYQMDKALVKDLEIVNIWIEENLNDKDLSLQLLKKYFDKNKLTEDSKAQWLLRLQNILNNYEPETRDYQLGKLEIIKLLYIVFENDIQSEKLEQEKIKIENKRKNIEFEFSNVRTDLIVDNYLLGINKCDNIAFFKNSSLQLFTDDEREKLADKEFFDKNFVFNKEGLLCLSLCWIVGVGVVTKYFSDMSVGNSALIVLSSILALLFFTSYMFRDWFKDYLLVKKVKKFLSQNLTEKEELLSFITSAEHILKEQAVKDSLRNACENYISWKNGWNDDLKESDVQWNLLNSYFKYLDEGEKNIELKNIRNRLDSEMEIFLLEGKSVKVAIGN